MDSGCRVGEELVKVVRRDLLLGFDPSELFEV